MHIFLTGDVQIGKSTVINRVLAELPWTVGGFRTGFGADRALSDRLLYLWDAAGDPVTDEAHCVVSFTDDRPEVLVDRFNELGCAALRRAREEGAQLILMDECGRLERHAAQLQEEIFSLLDGDVPVLGVVRQGHSGWLDQIRSHSKVTLLTVTKENRDTLHQQIISLLAK